MTVSVGSWSMTTCSTRCLIGAIITVAFGANREISQNLSSFRCHKNGVCAQNTIGLVVG